MILNKSNHETFVPKQKKKIIDSAFIIVLMMVVHVIVAYWAN